MINILLFYIHNNKRDKNKYKNRYIEEEKD